MQKIQSMIIPAMGTEEFKTEFTQAFQELIDKQHKVIDIKYQMSAFYDSEEDHIGALYSALIIFVEQEENQGKEDESTDTEVHEN